MQRTTHRFLEVLFLPRSGKRQRNARGLNAREAGGTSGRAAGHRPRCAAKPTHATSFVSLRPRSIKFGAAKSIRKLRTQWVISRGSLSKPWDHGEFEARLKALESAVKPRSSKPEYSFETQTTRLVDREVLMINSNRLDLITKRMTPKQLFISWMNEALRLDTIEAYVRSLPPQHELPMERLGENVTAAIRESFKNRPKEEFRAGLLKAEQEVNFLRSLMAWSEYTRFGQEPQLARGMPNDFEAKVIVLASEWH